MLSSFTSENNPPTLHGENNFNNLSSSVLFFFRDEETKNKFMNAYRWKDLSSNFRVLSQN